jgi:ABC-type lipoprotein export system ATPase subunit
MLVLQNLAKMYRTHAAQVRALDGVSLTIDKGEFVAVCGPSGSGKTTLLMMIAAMLRPSSGTVRFEDRDVVDDRPREPVPEKIGFVFQMFHLVPYLNVLENVLLAAAVVRRRHRRAQAEELLQRLGLQHRLGHRPSELSAGEKQRTAIARALLNQPKLILADEPTGNLDPENARCVLRHLQDFQKDGGTVIMATHGSAAQEFAARTISLREGRLVNHDS